MSKYWAIFRIQLRNNLAYTGNFLTGSLAIILFMFVFAHLWRAAYAATGTPVIAGMVLEDVLWYLLIAEVIELSKPRLAQSIAESVRDGSIAYQLNKPYHFILYQGAVGFGDSALRLLLNALIGGTVVWSMMGPPPAVSGWLFTAITIFNAWLIYFCINALIGLAAFVTEEVRAFEWIYQKFIFILGGFLIPLEFYPPWLQAVARATPFPYAIYGPARLFVDPSWPRFVEVFIGQALWIAILGGLLTWAYRRGTGWLVINGG